ncbi:MAG: flagellar hook-basal body complex protein FliE [Candidatus Sulfotelmatobacter sp.]|jgi:flagellar hook-basal body complex protein FliE
MAAPIAPVTLANPATAIQLPASAVSASPPQQASAFHSMFENALNTVQGFQTEADTAVQNFLSGNNEDVHTAIIATQKADLSFELFTQIRNKVVSAYQELMRMQV